MDRPGGKGRLGSLGGLKLRLDLPLEVSDVALELMLMVLDLRQGLLVLLAGRRQIPLEAFELAACSGELGALRAISLRAARTRSTVSFVWSRRLRTRSAIEVSCDWIRFRYS